MSDRRLRDLERAWREGAAPEAEAAWLRARLRAGDLPRERLELAAYLGYAPARDALDDPPRPGGDLEAWVRGLGRWGQEPAVRAALAAARLVLPLWEARDFAARAFAAGEPPDEGLRAAEAWLADPGPRAARRAREVADAGLGAHLVALVDHLPEDAARPVLRDAAGVFRELRAATFAALAAAEPTAGRAASAAVQAAVAARERLALAEAPPGPGGDALHARAAHADRLGHLPELNLPRVAARVRAAVAAELSPWARAELGVTADRS